MVGASRGPVRIGVAWMLAVHLLLLGVVVVGVVDWREAGVMVAVVAGVVGRPERKTEVREGYGRLRRGQGAGDALCYPHSKEQLRMGFLETQHISRTRLQRLFTRRESRQLTVAGPKQHLLTLISQQRKK